jgi:hypothetical protein
MTWKLKKDTGWSGVEFSMGQGVELEVSGAGVHPGSYDRELTFTVKNPGTEVTKFASWDCVFERNGAVVGGESSSIVDPIVPGGSVLAKSTISVDSMVVDQAICRAYG